ncbi:MAG: acyltransferase family protein, partial [Rothia sp. (in: high G+C Gram-positive bacteria)]|nr:acyltransferase family protein [Rothia sp. (in: high G+C Gram-positive bacteria)]
GVDVFLLISAFLMAGSFTRKLENKSFAGVKTIVQYWIHVFKRILPLASVTVVGIMLGSYLILPEERWVDLISEAKSVVFYYENWWSIANLVDYYAADSSVASPFRHFWSLSLQGQIYIIWPLIFMMGWLILRATRMQARTLMTVLFGAVFVGSLAYSIYATAANQQTAYFNTFARLWEFALGSLVAIILPWLNINRYIRAVMGWAGIAMIISCGFIFDVEGVFPGYHALWPTLAASMIIVAGDTQTKFGPEKLLTLNPLIKLGGFSYALYLIHWPLLVFFLYRNHTEKAGWVSGIGLLTISMILAYLVTRWIETPLRSIKSLDRSKTRGLAVIIACMALVLIPAWSWQAKINHEAQQAALTKDLNNPGAKVLDSAYQFQGDPNAATYPALSKLPDDWAPLGEGCAQAGLPFETKVELNDFCSVANKVDNPERTVVAVGNSHMQVWAPTVTAYAKEHNWNLYFYLEGGCFFDTPAQGHENDCKGYSNQAMQFVQDSGASTVFLTGSESEPSQQDHVTDGMKNRISTLTQEGKEVIALRDHPRFDAPFTDCIDQGKDCTKPAGQDVNNNPLTPLESTYQGFATVNVTDLVCPNGTCPAVIGNVYTYMDANHVSNSYVETTIDAVKPRFDEALQRANSTKKQ